MTKTSPIEMTVDTFGNLTFIVETSADRRRSRSHSSEKSFFETKQAHAKGIDAEYTDNRYKRDFLGCSLKRTQSTSSSGGGIIT